MRFTVSIRPLAVALLAALGALGSCVVTVERGGGGSGGAGGVSSWAACQVSSDCVLAGDSCCGPCGMPSIDDVDGVNRGRINEHFNAVCPAPVPCPLCPVANNPALVATCAVGACAAVDIRQRQLSACSADGDCRLRTTGCCECGGSTLPSDLIAINVGGEADYQALVCDPQTACPACAPVYPSDVAAYCGEDGHCAVRTVDDCGANCASQGLSCCGATCVATYNDIFNCGGCDIACGGEQPYCDGTVCTAPPCAVAGCPADAFCCGAECCMPGWLCCTVPGPGPSGGPTCVMPDQNGTCPIGCPLCQ